MSYPRACRTTMRASPSLVCPDLCRPGACLRRLSSRLLRRTPSSAKTPAVERTVDVLRERRDPGTEFVLKTGPESRRQRDALLCERAPGECLFHAQACRPRQQTKSDIGALHVPQRPSGTDGRGHVRRGVDLRRNDRCAVVDTEEPPEATYDVVRIRVDPLGRQHEELLIGKVVAVVVELHGVLAEPAIVGPPLER